MNIKQLSDFKIIKAGIFDSRYAFGHEDGFVTRERELSCYEIELYIENRGKTFMDEKALEISKGWILVGKPGKKRHSELHFKCYYIHLEAGDGLIKQYLDELPDYFEVRNDRLYEELFLHLIELNDSAFSGKELCVASKMYELLFAMHTDANKAKTAVGDVNEKKLERAREFIENNYTEGIKLRDIAGFVNLSPVYFHKLFKNRYGESPTQYLQSVRLFKAKKLLLATDYTVEEIAYSCGFSSQSYFNYFFKTKVNLSPVQFRKSAFNNYSI